MPTLSRKDQQKRNRQAYRAIRDFDGSNNHLANILLVNKFYISAVMNERDCSECLWKALLKANMVQPIPREQSSFLVPIDNLPMAIEKMQQYYPYVVLIRKWVQQ